MSENDEPDASGASDGGASDNKDYIFRGEDEPTDWAERSGAAPTPPPMPPPMPPGAAPVPPPNTPGAPPPPVYAPAPEGPKRKKWPWIVAALVVFCALPLGGCVALIAFGFSEIGEREDTIQAVADDFMNDVVAGRADATIGLMDGGAECIEPTRFAQLLVSDLPASDGWEADDVSFVDRDGNSYLANVSDAEEFVYPGREEDGFAVVSGRLLSSGATEATLEIVLLKPDDVWRVCAVGVL